MSQHALNQDDSSHLPHEYLFLTILQVYTISYDKDTRPECENVGLRMQFNWALYSYKYNQA